MEVPRNSVPAKYRWALLDAGENVTLVVILVQFLGRKKMAHHSQQLEGRRIWSLAVMVKRRRSQMHLFSFFFDLQPRFKITRVQSHTNRPTVGQNWQIFAPQNAGDTNSAHLWPAL